MRIIRRILGLNHNVVVSDTGNQTSVDGGSAVTGFEGDLIGRGSVRVQRTGDATAVGEGASAVTGVRLPRGGKIRGRVVVKNTGDATASGGGSACSGIDYS